MAEIETQAFQIESAHGSRQALTLQLCKPAGPVLPHYRYAELAQAWPQPTAAPQPCALAWQVQALSPQPQPQSTTSAACIQGMRNAPMGPRSSLLSSAAPGARGDERGFDEDSSLSVEQLLSEIRAAPWPSRIRAVSTSASVTPAVAGRHCRIQSTPSLYDTPAVASTVAATSALTGHSAMQPPGRPAHAAQLRAATDPQITTAAADLGNLRVLATMPLPSANRTSATQPLMTASAAGHTHWVHAAGGASVPTDFRSNDPAWSGPVPMAVERADAGPSFTTLATSWPHHAAADGSYEPPAAAACSFSSHQLLRDAATAPAMLQQEQQQQRQQRQQQERYAWGAQQHQGDDGLQQAFDAFLTAPATAAGGVGGWPSRADGAAALCSGIGGIPRSGGAAHALPPVGDWDWYNQWSVPDGQLLMPGNGAMPGGGELDGTAVPMAVDVEQFAACQALMSAVRTDGTGGTGPAGAVGHWPPPPAGAAVAVAVTAAGGAAAGAYAPAPALSNFPTVGGYSYFLLADDAEDGASDMFLDVRNTDGCAFLGGGAAARGPAVGGGSAATASAPGGSGVGTPAGDTTLAELRPLFDLPLADVVRVMGLSASELKRRCRALGIRRWPQRKLQSLRNLDEAVRTDPDLRDADRQEILQRIARNREAILSDPDSELEPALKPLRQAHYKRHFESRHAAGDGGGGGALGPGGGGGGGGGSRRRTDKVPS